MARIGDRFTEKVVFITGGGGGIATTSAELFADEGAKVFVTDVDERTGGATVDRLRSLGGDAEFAQCDATDPASLQAAFAACADHYGRLNVLFNCAGGTLAGEGSLTDTDFDLWRRSLDLNLMHVMYSCRFGLPYLRENPGSTIVNVASIAAVVGSTGAAMYSAAKGGVISLTRVVASMGAADGVRANAVAPGLIRTERLLELVRTLTGSRDGLPPRVAELARNHPFTVGDPIDIANIVLFLASHESRMLTGEVIHADGGARAY